MILDTDALVDLLKKGSKIPAYFKEQGRNYNISLISLIEYLSYKDIKEELVDELEKEIRLKCKVIVMDDDIARLAAKLRREYFRRPKIEGRKDRALADSLVLATAIPISSWEWWW